MMMLAILFSLKTMETLESGSQTPFWSVIAELMQLNVELGSIYIKHQQQRCNNSATTLVILFSLKSIESLQIGIACVNERLGPVYNKHQRQLCDDPSNSVLIDINGDAWKWVATPILKRHCRVVPLHCILFGASSQSCCSVDADTWCKRPLRDVSVQDGLN